MTRGIVVIVVALSALACKKPDPLVGSWQGVPELGQEFQVALTQLPPNKRAEFEQQFRTLKFSLDLKDDGKYVSTGMIEMVAIQESGDWSVSEDGATLTLTPIPTTGPMENSTFRYSTNTTPVVFTVSTDKRTLTTRVPDVPFEINFVLHKNS